MYLMNRFPHKRNTDVTVGQTVYRIGPGGFICDSDDERAPLDVPDVDAARLVQGRAWSQLNWDPSDPDNARRFMSPADYPKGQGLGRPPRTMDQMKADYGLTDEKATMKPVSRGELPAQQIGVGTSKDGKGGLTSVEAAAPSDSGLEKSISTDRDTQSQDMAHQKKLGIQHEEFQQDAMDGGAAVGDGRVPSAEEIPDSTPTINVIPGDMPPAEYPAVPVEGQHWPDPTIKMSKEYLTEMADAYGISYAKNIGTKTLAKRIHEKMYA